MVERALKTEALPPPSAELVLWRATTEAILALYGRKRAERFLKGLAARLATEENLSAVFSIRPTEAALQVREARRQAAAVFDAYLPIFLARLPDE